ncbi:hypothetical protein Droror1_Dr00020976 [Drosera rotundifolia]
MPALQSSAGNSQEASGAARRRAQRWRRGSSPAAKQATAAAPFFSSWSRRCAEKWAALGSGAAAGTTARWGCPIPILRRQGGGSCWSKSQSTETRVSPSPWLLAPFAPAGILQTAADLHKQRDGGGARVFDSPNRHLGFSL